MSKFSLSLVAHTVFRKLFRPRVFLVLALLAIAPLAVQLYWEKVWGFRDTDQQRGAATVVEKDLFGDAYSRVKYLSQGWSEGDSTWFYSTTQGSDLVPYDFFFALESAGKTELLNSQPNILRWRYLPQRATVSNPDGLPVGIVKDHYKGREYLGFTCAACHTGQVNYNGVALRIDGGPSMADMDTFMYDLGAAINATASQVNEAGQCNAEGCKRFVQRVLARGNYKREAEVIADLQKYQRRISAYNRINHSDTAYGYSRLDAFGRIYNRVLEHVLQKPDLARILPDIYSPQELTQVQQALVPMLSGAQVDHVVERSLPLLNETQRAKFLKYTFNSPNAPVSYPFLWDISQHDYVQWNGLAANAGLGPVGRNTGEVVGVFGTLDWKIESGFSISSLISGQGFSNEHIKYESSVRVHNLRRIENHLTNLQSPLWDDEVLGALDGQRISRGAQLFEQHCAACHAEIERTSSDRRVVANMTKLSEIGTDPQMAMNSVQATGFSGILRNQYVAALDVGNILIDTKAPVAALLTKATTGVVAEPYPSWNFLARGFDWLYDISTAYFNNRIKSSIKQGNYEVDTTAAPFASLQAYKGRSLNGIWATAPYLHNGSVPTLYDLLLPKRQARDPAGGEYRPESFMVGSREFDPQRVGYITQGYQGFLFDTKKKGNSNAGHEYGTLHDTTLSARGLKPMSKEDRLDLLEYLKAL